MCEILFFKMTMVDQFGSDISITGYFTSISVTRPNVGKMIGVGIKKTNMAIVQINTNIIGVKIAKNVSCLMNCGYNNTDINRDNKFLVGINLCAGLGRVWVNIF